MLDVMNCQDNLNQFKQTNESMVALHHNMCRSEKLGKRLKGLQYIINKIHPIGMFY